MGLDMYLTKRVYIGNKWKEPKDQVKIKVKGVKQGRVYEIIEEVGYWRKANAIHRWFVENVQNGNDDCEDYHVEAETLIKLLELVTKVLKDPKKAKKLLPPQEGFFFGTYGYDDWYFDNLKETKKILEKVLKEEGDYYYHSSW